MNRKKLVLFTSDYPFGAGETFLETEIKYLCNAFDQVIIITQNQSAVQTRVVPKNCSVKRIELDYSLTTRLTSLLNIFIPIVRTEIRRVGNVYQKKITLGILKTILVSFQRAKQVRNYIHTHFHSEFDQTLFYSYWCDDTALGIALSAFKDKHVTGISRAHGWDTYFEVSAVNYLPFRSFISSNLKALFPISEKGKEIIYKSWKITRNDHIIVSRLGVNNPFQPVTPEGTVKIVSCSNVNTVKRVHLIAEALSQITSLPIEWTHFGDGDLLIELEKKVKKLPVNITVHLRGRIPNNEIFKAYQEIKPHVFMNVSSSEGIPVSIMEAMSFGIPCIVTNVGGNTEIVTTQNGIILQDPPHRDLICSAIYELLEQPEKRGNAYQTWKTLYHADKNYTSFTSVILNL